MMREYELKDSGTRQEFQSGAVRDIQKGKGRFDLLPLEEIHMATMAPTNPNIYILQAIDEFKSTGRTEALQDLSMYIAKNLFDTDYEYVESLAKHFEAGVEKYGENNWQKGIPASRYINSASRHFFKYLANHTDEPHKAAFAWNILCCWWTCRNKPEFNDYKTDGVSNG